MVTLKSNNFDLGLANGTALTPLNTGMNGQAPFDATVSTSQTASTAAAHGTYGVSFFGSSAYVQWTTLASSYQAVRFNMRAGWPLTNHRILQFGNTQGSCIDLELRTDGTIRVRNSNSMQQFQSTAIPNDGRWLRVELDVFFNASAGQAKFRIYDGADTYDLIDSFDGNADGLFRAIPTYVRLGNINATDSNELFFADDFAVKDTAGFVGPVIEPNRVPTLGPNTYSPVAYGKSAVLFTAATDIDGGIINYAWSVTDGLASSDVQLSAAGAVCEVQSSKPGSVVVTCTVTDDDGATASMDHVVEFVNRAWTGQPGAWQPIYRVELGTVVDPEEPEGPQSIPGWDMRSFEHFETNASEGQFLQTYPLFDAYPVNYLTTHGGSAGVNNGDHYGGNGNLSVVDSKLVMRLYRDAATGKAVGAGPYPKFSTNPNDIYQLYGRYEIRYRIVPGGDPWWTTAWLMWPQSEVWPRDGEIDFREGTVGGEVHFNHHNQDGTNGGDQQQFTYPAGTNDGAWHTTVLEWKPNDCAVFSDGTLVGRVTSRVPNTPMRMALQTETLQSGTQPGAAPATCLIEIDYVRVDAYAPGTANDLEDDFSTASTAKWRDSATLGAWNAYELVSENHLVLIPRLDYAANLESAATYNITDKAIATQVVARPTQGGDNSTEAYFGFRADGNSTTNASFLLNGQGGIVWQQNLNGSEVDGGYTTYDDENMAWLRVRHSDDTLYFEASPDGIDWAVLVDGDDVQASFPAAISLTSVRPFFQAGYYGTQASPGQAVFDNFTFGYPPSNSSLYLSTS